MTFLAGAQVLAAGTTATGAFQNIGTGASGEVLTSYGAGALPSFQAAAGGGGFTSIVSQVFTSSGTFLPTSGLSFAIIEVCGGGGGGGGCDVFVSVTGAITVGGGGGGGGYSREIVTAATIGASQTVTIGAGGAGGAPGINAGAAGGTTSVGSIISATGGAGGAARVINGTSATALGGAGGVGSGGNFNITGEPGFTGLSGQENAVYGFGISGKGGNSYFSGGGAAVVAQIFVTSFNGNAGTNYGGGGSGAVNFDTTAGTSKAGGDGAGGIVVITEYII